MQAVAPEQLYHCSPVSGIKQIKTGRDRLAGRRIPPVTFDPVVFASHDQAYAARYLLKIYDDDAYQGVTRRRINGQWQDVNYVIIGNPDLYAAEAEKPGFTYTLPTDGFEYYNVIGCHNREWVSRKPVSVLREISHPNAAIQLMQFGTQVFVVPPKRFKCLMDLFGVDFANHQNPKKHNANNTSPANDPNFEKLIKYTPGATFLMHLENIFTFEKSENEKLNIRHIDMRCHNLAKRLNLTTAKQL